MKIVAEKKENWCVCGHKKQSNICEVCQDKAYLVNGKRYYRGRRWRLGNEKPFFHDDPETDFNL
jgi:hypothetical protein